MNGFHRALALLLFCFIAVPATAGNNSSRVSSDLKVTEGQKSGEIFGSIVSPIGSNEPVFMRYQVNFSPVGSTKSGGFFSLTNTMFDARTSYDVNASNFRGRTFRISLPVGEYEITSARMSSDTGMVRTNAKSERVSVRFSVGEGEKVYLGRFVGHGSSKKGLFGMRRENGGYFQVTDAAIEDIVLVQAKGVPFEPSAVRSANLQFPAGILRTGQ